MLVALAALAFAASPADDQRAEVERAVFDLCPRAMAGTLALGDAGQAEAAGYTPMAPRQTPAGANPRAVRGEGTARIVISSTSGNDRPVCSVWFGGPENRRLADMVRSRARANGFGGGGQPLRLGDGTRLYSYRRGSDSLILFDADAGGELDFEPATTVVLMTGVN
jgi:hypothetical protein